MTAIIQKLNQITTKEIDQIVGCKIVDVNGNELTFASNHNLDYDKSLFRAKKEFKNTQPFGIAVNEAYISLSIENSKELVSTLQAMIDFVEDDKAEYKEEVK